MAPPGPQAQPMVQSRGAQPQSFGPALRPQQYSGALAPPGVPPGVPPGARPPTLPPPQLGAHQPPGPTGFRPVEGTPSAPAITDAFEALSLGGGGPGVGGPPLPGAPTPPSGPAANPATFPRPAGTSEQKEAAVGPPPPYTPANCSPDFLRLTTHAAPNSQALKARWHLPYGAVVHPLNEKAGPVPVANPGTTTIVRCKRCRTYMNPFMMWADGGRRFTCNICHMVNECPVDYFAALDGSGRRIDVEQRPELSRGSVEYVAPAEYMVRAPMPPTYVFLLDVSFHAVSSGLLSAACGSIKACLDKLPGDDRTRVAIMTFDSSIHFYSLRQGASSPSMMVVPEIDDPFVPLPDELLTRLADTRPQLEKLLDSLPFSFAGNQKVDSAMGPALQAAFLVMNHVGGKLLLFQAAPPSLGIGKIKARDNPALYGTDREYALRSPDDPFYKRFSAEASRFQICIDVFAAGSTYQDIPSLGTLAKYTGGQIYYYPGFSADKEGGAEKLFAEVSRNLTRETAWEAVMRIRCSKGLRVSAFYGHFFVRSTDLLALPACDADKAFAVEIQHEETVVTGQTAYVQAALLYTSSNGERRIRVHTAALPIVSDLVELYRSSDAGATAALLAKVAVERSLSAKLDEVRNGVQSRLAAALREYRMLHGGGMSAHPAAMSQLLLPERLKSLPVLTMGLMKTSALRGSGRDVNADERAAVAAQLTMCPIDSALRLCYPACYRVDLPSGNWGKGEALGEAGAIELPSTVPAGLEYFDPSGVYLIDTGRIMILWLGATTPSSYYDAVFGPGSYGSEGRAWKVEPPRPGSELSERLCAVVCALRRYRDVHQQVHVVRQGTPMEAHVMPYFIEDRMTIGSGLPGYLEWMMGLQKQITAKA